MYNVTNVAGRLCVSTLVPPVTGEEISKFGEVWMHLMAGRKERVIVFGDYTRARLVDPHVRQLLTSFFNAGNPDVERSGILVTAESSLIFEQFASIIRGSMHPSRRIFKDPHLLEEWLGEVMTDEERASLKLVLRERFGGEP